jgi:4-amino-4-deoxy-L-arabinose transferase-like glycosyltransferase
VLWSALTTFNSSPNVALPYAGPAQQSDLPRVQQGDGQQGDTPQVLIEYLVANTDPDTYLVATYNANQAAPFILATGRPVLTFGGFLGSDNIIDADGLAQMVADGELRFVLGGGNMGKQEITSWVQANCKVVQNISGLDAAADQNAGPGNQQSVLYDCGK